MDGVIEVKSVYGVGSEFSIVIPQTVKNSTPIGKDVANKLEQLTYGTEKALSKLDFARRQFIGSSVLIVDDVAVNLEVIKGLLEPYNLHMKTVTSGQQAIDLIIDGNMYDIIFMDHMMPDMDGMEATRIIRNLNNDYVRNVPIVAFTANAMIDSNKMFLENGFNDFISKPIDIHKLDECLNKWIGKSEKKSELSEYLDIRQGITQFGSEAMFSKMLASFKKHIPKLLENLQEQSGNDYIISIHALKGCAKTIYANELGGRAYELEMAAKEGNWDLVRSKNEALIRDTQKLVDAINVE
jgi:CheY-like chemotaxis protein